MKETLKISAVRRKIVQKTVESKTQIPHYYIFSSFDMTEVLAGRKMFEQSNGIKPSIDTIMIKACALILEKYPLLNASWEQESIKIYEETRIGFIVDTGKGIMIPHLVDPHKKNLVDVEHYVREFAEKARNGRISPKELECGSLSISNLGMYNVDNFVPIIYPGEVAILGLGKFQKTAFWNDEKFIPREVMKVALSLRILVLEKLLKCLRCWAIYRLGKAMKIRSVAYEQFLVKKNHIGTLIEGLSGKGTTISVSETV